MLYPRKSWSGRYKPKNKYIDWMLGLQFGHQLWRWPWPWRPWISKVKYYIYYKYIRKNGPIAMQWKKTLGCDHSFWQQNMLRLPLKEKHTYRLNAKHHQFSPWSWPWPFQVYVTSNFSTTSTHPVDLRNAQFILGSTKIYFHFVLFLNAEMAEVL